MQFLRKYPLAEPLLWTSLGIWMGETFRWSLIALLSGAAVLWSAGWVRSMQWIVLPLLLILTGAARLELAVNTWSPHDLRHLAPREPTLAVVRGRLLETPLTRPGGSSAKPKAFSRATLSIEAIRLGGQQWRAATGKIVVSVPEATPPGFFGGCLVEISGVLAAPPPASTPGAFDFAMYLRQQDIHFELRTDGLEDWQLVRNLPTPPVPWSDRFQAWGRQILSLGFPAADPAIDLLCAMTLGWKPGLDPSSQDPFMKSGTLHVFAISGLHIALIALIGIECLRILGMPRALAGLIAIPVVWMYTALTGWQASAIRSAVMMSVVAGGWLLNRPAKLLNNLAGAALVLLSWDPQQLFQPGFQLSFLVVAHLGLLASPMGGVLQTVRFEEALLPERLQPRWRRCANRAVQMIRPHLATSAAAWVGSAPLMAHYFHVLSPVSLLANLVVVPLSSLALASCVASLACGPFLADLSELFNHSSWLLMHLMLQASVRAAELPGAWFYVPSPGWLGFLIYLAALGFYLSGQFAGGARRRRLAMVTLSALLSVAVVRWLIEGSACHLTLLARRSGVTAWIDEGQGRQQWLIDPGEPHETRRLVLPFLQAEGINSIANLVLSHATLGQSGGAEILEHSLTVYRRFVPQGNFRSPGFRRFIDEVRRQQLHLQPLSRPMALGNWEVLSPRPSTRSTAADGAALILRGTFNGCRVLWIPKLTLLAQDQLLAGSTRAQELEAEVVIAGMPSRGEPLPDPLLEAITPQWIIVADAAYPTSARATPQLRVRLSKGARRVLCCSDYPTLQLSFRNGRIELLGHTATVLRPSSTAEEP